MDISDTARVTFSSLCVCVCWSALFVARWFTCHLKNLDRWGAVLIRADLVQRSRQTDVL